MKKTTAYVSKKPDNQGVIHYDKDEHAIWRDLYQRQMGLIPQYACQEYCDAFATLSLPHDRIPQLQEVSNILNKETGWGVSGVPALIGYDKFFKLLASRQFPVATFIRTREEFEYLQEPDIFHEIFGHCPLLTHPVYADFMQAYGQLGANADEKTQTELARLYWFTVEFGLIHTKNGLRCYGAGLLSSSGETVYAIESDVPKRNPFNIIDALRTPYRIDIFQPLYYAINDFNQLYEIVKNDIMGQIKTAQKLGRYAPLFPPKDQP